jgi:hypothetical protein
MGKKCKLLFGYYERCPFSNKTNHKETTIPFELNDYTSLVDWSGRAILLNKKGYIPENTPPVLTRLGIDKAD